MENLSIFAPAIVGVLVALGALITAHRISKRTRNALAIHPETSDSAEPPLPFEEASSEDQPAKRLITAIFGRTGAREKIGQL